MITSGAAHAKPPSPDRSMPGADFPEASAVVEGEVRLVTTASELQKLGTLLSRQTVFSIDTETWGDEEKGEPLNKYLRLIQITIPARDANGLELQSPGTTFILDVEDLERVTRVSDRRSVLDPLKAALENESITKVAHNASFERGQFEKYGVGFNGIFDTMTIAQHQAPDLPHHTLQAIFKEYLGGFMPKDAREKGFRGELDLEQYVYSAKDSIETLRIYYKQKEIEDDFQLRLSELQNLEHTELAEIYCENLARIAALDDPTSEQRTVAYVRQRNATRLLKEALIEEFKARESVQTQDVSIQEDQFNERRWTYTFPDGTEATVNSSKHEIKISPEAIERYVPDYAPLVIDYELGHGYFVTCLVSSGFGEEAALALADKYQLEPVLGDIRTVFSIKHDFLYSTVESGGFSDSKEAPEFGSIRLARPLQGKIEQVDVNDLEGVELLLKSVQDQPFITFDLNIRPPTDRHARPMVDWVYIGLPRFDNIEGDTFIGQLFCINLEVVEQDHPTPGAGKVFSLLQSELLSNPNLTKIVSSRYLKSVAEIEGSLDIRDLALEVRPDLKSGPKAVAHLGFELLGNYPPPEELLLRLAQRTLWYEKMGKLDKSLSINELHAIEAESYIEQFVAKRPVFFEQQWLGRENAHIQEILASHVQSLVTTDRPRVEHSFGYVDVKVSANVKKHQVNYIQLRENEPEVAQLVEHLVSKESTLLRFEREFMTHNPWAKQADIDRVVAPLKIHTTVPGFLPIIPRDYSQLYATSTGLPRFEAVPNYPGTQKSDFEHL